MKTRHRTVLLLRHGEESGRDDDPSLNAAGWCRAWALVGYLQTRRGLSAPTRLLAASDDEDSCRPRATLGPLADALRLAVETPYGDKQYRQAARDVLNETTHPGAVTVMCWRHKTLIPLARALGAPAQALPRTWPETEYGWLVRIDYDVAGKTIAAAITSQRLMRGDTRSPASTSR